MPTHIALLRGVNVGGNLLKMDRLRTLCAELGLQNAQTYIQSGNLLFESPEAAAQLVGTLEQKLAGESRLPIAIILRTAGQWSRIVAGNPFLKQEGIDPARLYVSFLAGPASKAALKTLAAFDAGPDRYEVRGTEIYLHCPHGYGTTRLSNNTLEKLLGRKATTRNWNTLLKLHALAAG